ncbi:hypothetical protein [Embleya hyalina]|uniref:Uncharacterized protein n=1 Tax=Embleya hyalina TaxID=516124 RepID=A0A401YZE3_9ACTN|nr:hypothetical protein [Embleya hyalina]GCD99875.1 hypothetical protein EHYA_07597 [Embleya hyalina]
MNPSLPTLAFLAPPSEPEPTLTVAPTRPQTLTPFSISVPEQAAPTVAESDRRPVYHAVSGLLVGWIVGKDFVPVDE